MSTSFFVEEAGGYRATELVRGPWDPRFAHGGPPSALLARAAERDGAAHGLPHLARLTVDLLRPVPIARFAVRVTPVREGRSARVVTAELIHDGEILARATALSVRRRPIDVERVSPAAPLPTREGVAPFRLPFFLHEVGYHEAIELRFVEGAFGEGPTAAWTRMRVPLVPGEAPSGFVRAVVVADSGNGISPVLDWRTHTFVNPDLAVSLFREPAGEWIGMRSTTSVDPSGVGMAHTALFDDEGPCGHGVQNLLLSARREG